MSVICVSNVLKNSMTKTLRQFDAAVKSAKDIFMKKMYDYGTAWRILRTSSITDQVYIKALRIKSIEEKGTQKIEEDVTSDYIGIFNYAVIALIQLHLKDDQRTEIPPDEVEQLFDQQAGQARTL